MSTFRLPLRVIPPEIRGSRRAQRMLERQWIITRNGGWRVIVSGFFEPLFYLLSMQVGLSSLIGDVTVDGRPVSYVQFVAPALFAASAMNGAIYETTMNIFFKLRYDRIYDAALATPLTAGDVALGEISHATLRGGLYSAAFLVTMALMGTIGSWWALAMVPVAIVVAFSFSAVGMASTTFMRSWADFDFVPTVLLPLFLFSATFYPASSYGEWAWLVNLSPLYHAVAVCRALNLGHLGWGLAGHLAVLAALGLIGLTVTARRFARLLLP